VRPREVTSLFQTTARAWLSLALVSLALPVRWRLGLWLPLHLTLAGAASTAIAGAMPNFVLAMTASAGPSTSVVRIRAGLLAAGVLALATGMVTGWSPLVAIGGTSFAASMAMLGHLVWRAWRTSLVRRRGVLVAGYGIAVGCVLVGATLGGLIGSGAVVDGVAQVRRAHAVLNVLGFVSLTVLATLVTFVPTLLRVRMPARRSGPAVASSCAGVALLALGAGAGWMVPFAVGGWLLAVGALLTASLAVAALRRPRGSAVPAAAFHVGAGLAWFVVGALGLAVAGVRGPTVLDTERTAFLAVFVAGWNVQVLLGAWIYLVPMATPGHPQERRGWLAVGEVGGRTQVVIANLGIALLLARAEGWVGAPIGMLGAIVALVAAAGALIRVWAFRWLARRLPVSSGRAVYVWGASD
jgi:nitrite reductase (NO-forming)